MALISSALLIIMVVGGIIAGPTVPVSSNGTAIASPTPAHTRSARELTFTDGEYNGVAVLRTEDEWKKLLTETEYYIMRGDGTEGPYTGELLNNKKNGTYHCAACGLVLFSSKHKYGSERGWPSFYQPIFKRNIAEKPDKSLAEERIEVECARCGAHLGHVFDDGPPPTGLRYCINSVSLRVKGK